MLDTLQEIPLPSGGFRRSGPVANPVRWSALRQRLSQAATGQGRAVQDGLALFRSWEDAGMIATAVLPPVALRGGEASRRALQRSLRILGTRATTISALAPAPRGTAARVTGRVLAARWKVSSHIWFKSEMTQHNVRLLIEEGHDFFLTEASGRLVLVQSAGGYLLGAPGTAIDVADQVEVFGFVDRVVDGGSPGGSGSPRGEPITLALRAGDELPIIIRRAAGPMQAAGAPRERETDQDGD
jgi:hypothetical protein